MNTNTIIANTKRKRGFTLLELIVSIGLFTIVITIVASAYLSLISLDRKARATNDVVSNLSFVMESISRSIRTGTRYSCNGGTNCWPGGSPYFWYTNERCESVAYRLKNNGTIGQCVGPADIPNCQPAPVTCTDSSAATITDPRINVTNLMFYAQGVGSGDGLQPRVLFTTSGSITPDTQSTPITYTIESSATERLIELGS